jgi:hypothetical protein
MTFFRKDARVSHPELGAGTVVTADRRYTTIAFDDGAVRKFVTSMVRLERSAEPRPAAAPSTAPRRRQTPLKAQNTAS